MKCTCMVTLLGSCDSFCPTLHGALDGTTLNSVMERHPWARHPPILLRGHRIRLTCLEKESVEGPGGELEEARRIL